MSSRLPKIKRCPFCGHSASLEEHPQSDKVSNYGVGCDNEEELCVGYQSLTLFATKAEAVAAWNKRYGEAEVEKFQISDEFKKVFSRKQLAVLTIVVEANGTPVPFERLMNKVYLGKDRTPSSMRVMISHTNKKLEQFGARIVSRHAEHSFETQSGLETVKGHIKKVGNDEHEDT